MPQLVTFVEHAAGRHRRWLVAVMAALLLADAGFLVAGHSTLGQRASRLEARAPSTVDGDTTTTTAIGTSSPPLPSGGVSAAAGAQAATTTSPVGGVTSTTGTAPTTQAPRTPSTSTSAPVVSTTVPSAAPSADQTQPSTVTTLPSTTVPSAPVTTSPASAATCEPVPPAIATPAWMPPDLPMPTGSFATDDIPATSPTAANRAMFAVPGTLIDFVRFTLSTWPTYGWRLGRGDSEPGEVENAMTKGDLYGAFRASSVYCGGYIAVVIVTMTVTPTTSTTATP